MLNATATPWMHDDAIAEMRKFVRGMQRDNTRSGPVRVLEFGSGASTVWFDALGCRVLTVEHMAKWANKVRQATTWRVFVTIHPLPYAGYCDYLSDQVFDMILVDGRGRTECVRQSMRLLARGGYLILDDANRGRYRSIRQLMREAGWQAYVVASTEPTDIPMIKNAPNRTRVTAFYQKPRD